MDSCSKCREVLVKASALVILVAGHVAAVGVTPANAITGQLMWTRGYASANAGNDRGRATATDRWGNVYVTGESFRASSGVDFLTVKYDKYGVTKWIRRFTTSGNRSDAAVAIRVDYYGNVYVVGTARPGGAPRICTVSYNTNGTQKWVAYDGVSGILGASGIKVDIDAGRNVLIGGSVRTVGTGWDFYLAKRGPSGNLIWARRYDAPAHGDDRVTGMALDSAGAAYLCGSMGGRGYSITKYNSTGVRAWVRSRMTSSGATAIAVTGSGVYACGLEFGYGLVTKSDRTTGAFVRSVAIPTAEQMTPDMVANASGVVVAAETIDGPQVGGDVEISTIKYTTDLMPVWRADSFRAGGAHEGCGPEAEAVGVEVNSSGEVFTLCYLWDDDAMARGFVTLKYSAAGVPAWEHSVFGGAEGTPAGIALGPGGAFYVTGEIWRHESLRDQLDYGTAKYAQ